MTALQTRPPSVLVGCRPDAPSQFLYLRRQLGERVHFWPFDGWQIPPGRSAVVEVYPALWKPAYAANGRSADQHDAYSAAAWLRQTDLDGQLARFLNPELTGSQRTVASVEGWILPGFFLGA